MIVPGTVPKFWITIVRKPYYLKSRNTWMVWLNGRQERLGKGITEDEAYRKYEELRHFRGALRPTSRVVSLFDSFLEDLHVNNATSTYEWYKHFLTSSGSSFRRARRRERKSPG
jgi:hypothetical protein